jgi:hypothetical protein
MRLTASKTPPTPPAISAYEAAIQIVSRLDAQEAELRAEELARFKRGDKIEADEIASIAATEAAADALLRGEVVKSRKKRTIRDIVHERAVVRLAMDKAQSKVELARRELAAEKFALSLKEQRDVGREICQAIFALDRALRARDKLVTRIGLPAGTLAFEAWPLAGRLSLTHSEAFRFCETGVQNGWISQQEFDDEYAAARKADAWR